MKSFLRRRVADPLLAQLRQGTSPEKLALSAAVGFTLGCFPVVGVTTTLGVAAAVVFKLNHAAVQVANYAAYPLQIALLYPLFRLGRAWFSFAGEGWVGGVLGTITAWGLFAPAAAVVLYYASLPAMRWARARSDA
jgi:uncharacterized protein (DUF2062 family)